jgi:hypothetical protein
VKPFCAYRYEEKENWALGTKIVKKRMKNLSHSHIITTSVIS